MEAVISQPFNGLKLNTGDGFCGNIVEIARSRNIQQNYQISIWCLQVLSDRKMWVTFSSWRHSYGVSHQKGHIRKYKAKNCARAPSLLSELWTWSINQASKYGAQSVCLRELSVVSTPVQIGPESMFFVGHCMIGWESTVRRPFSLGRRCQFENDNQLGSQVTVFPLDHNHLMYVVMY